MLAHWSNSIKLAFFAASSEVFASFTGRGPSVLMLFRSKEGASQSTKLRLQAGRRGRRARSEVEYYLSDENLVRDAFFQAPNGGRLMKSEPRARKWLVEALIRGSTGGWIPISTFLGPFFIARAMCRQVALVYSS